MAIDTHCHLNFEAFSEDLDSVISRATDLGVSKFVVPGAKLESSIKALEISQKHDGVFATVGVHPHHVDEFTEDVFLKLKLLLENKLVVAVGEVGLDLHNYQSKGVHPLEQQIDALKKQLDLAVDFKKSVIIHCRNAYEEIDSFIESYIREREIAGVFHCFTGRLKHLERVLKMGFYVSFAGNVTYNGDYDLLLKNTPIERLLLETDSPFLSPKMFRGQRNEPKNLLITANYIAKIKGVELNELLERTTINTRSLFGI